MTLYQSIVQEGIEQGIEKGSWQKNIEVIVNGYNKGLSVEFLADITGLDVSQVEEIIAGHKENFN